MVAATERRLVGDIGGTNTRLALFDPATGELSAVHNYTNDQFPGLEAIIDRWLRGLHGSPPVHCCLAIAAPPFGDRVRMINIDWSFSQSELGARFGFTRVRCINDFEANAYALPHLQATDLHTLRSGDSGHCRKYATVGPGTGLGGATLEYCLDTPVANASEPGHMGLSPATDQEIELFRLLIRRHGEVYAELLLSGPGLSRLHRTLAEVRGEAAGTMAPDAITAAALAGESDLCRETLRTFCALLGSICGDYTLATGSYGGLYLAGGIAPRILPLLTGSDFSARFSAKGEMRGHLERVPLYVVTRGTQGLTGAARAPL